jgi:hypothetical protein
MRFFIIVIAMIGMTAGAYLPLFWGGSVFSGSSILLSGLGGFLGIWWGYKIGRNIGF